MTSFLLYFIYRRRRILVYLFLLQHVLHANSGPAFGPAAGDVLPAVRHHAPGTVSKESTVYKYFNVCLTPLPCRCNFQGSAVLLPLVRISPVLCCGTALTGSHTGSDIPALIAIASVTGQQDTLHIEAVTLPISIWTNLPFLERLLAFAEPICARAQEDPGTRLKGSAANPWTQDAKSELR